MATPAEQFSEDFENTDDLLQHPLTPVLREVETRGSSIISTHFPESMVHGADTRKKGFFGACIETITEKIRRVRDQGKWHETVRTSAEKTTAVMRGEIIEQSEQTKNIDQRLAELLHKKTILEQALASIEEVVASLKSSVDHDAQQRFADLLSSCRQEHAMLSSNLSILQGEIDLMREVLNDLDETYIAVEDPSAANALSETATDEEIQSRIAEITTEIDAINETLHAQYLVLQGISKTPDTASDSAVELTHKDIKENKLRRLALINEKISLNGVLRSRTTAQRLVLSETEKKAIRATLTEALTELFVSPDKLKQAASETSIHLHNPEITILDWLKKADFKFSSDDSDRIIAFIFQNNKLQTLHATLLNCENEESVTEALTIASTDRGIFNAICELRQTLQ